MEKEKWNFPGWFNKQNFDWFMWNCRKSFNVIAAVLYKCIRVTAQFLLPALFEEEQLTNKTEQDSYITDSCVVGKKPEQEEENDPDNIPGIIYQDLSDDEDEDRRDNGLIEGIENLNNQYPGIPNEQPADNALSIRITRITYLYLFGLCLCILDFVLYFIAIVTFEALQFTSGILFEFFIACTKKGRNTVYNKELDKNIAF